MNFWEGNVFSRVGLILFTGGGGTVRSKLMKFEHLWGIPTVQGPDPCVHVAFTLNATV